MPNFHFPACFCPSSFQTPQGLSQTYYSVQKYSKAHQMISSCLLGGQVVELVFLRTITAQKELNPYQNHGFKTCKAHLCYIYIFLRYNLSSNTSLRCACFLFLCNFLGSIICFSFSSSSLQC